MSDLNIKKFDKYKENLMLIDDKVISNSKTY